MSKYLWLIGLLVAAGALWWYANGRETPVEFEGTANVAAVAGYKDGTYLVNDESVTLEDGVAKEPIVPGSASVKTTRYFGNEAMGDLNGDGKADVAFILTQESGGSGIFYYIAAAIAQDDGYTGTNAVLIGDRISPQTTRIQGGQVIVNYADRASGEPMSVMPSIGKTTYLQIDPTTLRLIAIPDHKG